MASPILCNDPGSFPWSVFHVRYPELLQRVRDASPFGPEVRDRLDELGKEIVAGPIVPPDPQWHDHDSWARWHEPYAGKPWSETPFLWAENYFFRRILAATGFFEPGAMHGIDPFGPFKSAELASEATDSLLTEFNALATGAADDAQTEALFYASLQANHADLCFNLGAAGVGGAPPGAGLLVDDTPAAVQQLTSTAPGRIALIADNAARELLPDLLLIDHLLHRGLAAEVDLYVKPSPYFVSDAMPSDVIAALDRLIGFGGPATEAGRRLWDAVQVGRVALHCQPDFCAPLHLWELPADLVRRLATASMVITKGDLNYRRLVGDNWWSPTRPFREAVDWLSAPVVALRTLKSDVIVGLDPAVVESLDQESDGWRSAGTRAVIQFAAD
ncbi:MAG TPA: ARMT1-like domain-containing protein [Flexivirga sp.]|uniref:ARMT1-like domain-containing protein n=1 Tax=Flexivirga sp. TaxID=1962927 RepID=UPI002CAABFD5|nr:ARMT1-like domain-containing protein [Flexivirga sp.]HWC21791.1 ARMT1-like domain-containing protein [Flexivirga sp.]